MNSRGTTALPSSWAEPAGKRRLIELAAEVALIRRHLKDLTRAKDSLRSQIPISVRIQRRAALAYELSQDPQWGLMYVRLRQRQRLRASVREPCEIETRQIEEWLQVWKQEACFKESLANKCHPDRVVVDEFLLQSLLYEFVENQSARGLMVTSSVISAKYLQLWAFMDKTAAQTRRLDKIQRSATTRASWCKRFRKFWNLDWGAAPKSVSMTVSCMKSKARETV